MGKSSRSIKLALIGSALLLPGCQGGEDEPIEGVAAPVDEFGGVAAGPVEEFGNLADDGGYFGPESEAPPAQAAANGQNGSNGTYYRRNPAAAIAGGLIGSQIARSMSRGGGLGGFSSAPASAPSARGGFGASGGRAGGGLGASS